MAVRVAGGPVGWPSVWPVTVRVYALSKLPAILGYADILVRRKVPDAKARQFYDEIYESGKRLSRIVEMLEFSAAAGVIHYIWLVKADLKKPLEYASVLGLLILYRLIVWLGSRPPAPAKINTSESRIV